MVSVEEGAVTYNVHMRTRISGIMLALAAVAPLAAQTVTGTVEGRVTDASGGVIAAAEVNARNAETALTRSTKTNQDGYYRLTFLPSGEYTVSAVSSGFARKERTVSVEVNSTHNVEFELQPTAVSTQMTVVAEAPDIETTRGEVKITVEERAIEDRPLSSRNFLSLVEMLPGFQTTGGYSGVNNPTLSSGSYVSMNGTGSRSVTFQIDGVNNDDSSEGINRQNVNVSAIKEFQVLTNAYSPEFGRGATGVLVQTKSGTNVFHGDAYEFFQNEKLNANTFFGNASGRNAKGDMISPRAPYRRNQFGYTVGGPIVKNKLFIFHSFEQTRLVQYNVYTRWIFLPTDKLQIGTCRLCIDPAQHPNAQQDLNFLQGIMDRFPKAAPNNPNLCDHCFTGMMPAYYPDQDYSGRLDYYPWTSDTMVARYQYSRQKRTPYSLIPGENAYQNNRQANLGFTETHMFTPATIGEFRFGLGVRTTIVDISSGNDTPIVRISNPSPYTTTSLGSAGQFPIHRYQTDYQLVYNLSHLHGRHTLRGGIDFRRQHLDDLADNYSRGYWTFAATGTLGSTSRYEGWENFLRGYETDYQKGYGNFTTYNRLGESNQWVNDDIKLLPNLTVNLGFRWEVVLKPTEANNKINYTYSTFTKGYEPRFGMAWSPNAADGFWKWITGGPGKSSVRAGFGLFHSRIFQSVFSQGGISLRSLPPYGAYNDFGSSFHTADPSDGWAFNPASYNPGRITGVRIDPTLGMPSFQMYNLTVERVFPAKTMVRLSYNRTRGIGLLQNQITNRAQFPFLSPVDGVLYDKIDPDLGDTSPPPGYISQAQPRINQRRPDKNYSSIYVISNGSWSYYNALQLLVQKRYTHGLQWQVAYSFSKSIDTGSDVTGPVAITANDSAKSLRALSDFYQHHRVNINFSYLLPFFAKEHGFRRAVLGGWTLSTNDTFATGNPFTVGAGYDLNADGVSNDRPILLDQPVFGRSVDNPRPNPATGLPISVGQLPLSAFFPTVSTPGTARPFDPGGSGKGSIGRNTFFGQGLLNVDAGLYKSFRVREGMALTFRAEMYGVTNTPHFGLPTASVLSQSFGRISGTYNPFNYVGASRSDASARVVQLALRLTF
jgi:hypothetical protein